MQIIIIILLSTVLSLLLFLLWQSIHSAPKSEEFAILKSQNDQKEQQLAELKKRAERVDDLQSQNARLAADLDNERKNTQEKLRLLQESEARLKLEFENLANRIFEEKSKTFTNQSNEKLGGLLNPFREQIESFRKRVDEVHRNDTEGFAKLLEQVRQLQELNTRVSEEANNLAGAIKGDAKAQGNWGELIVERIFEASGLERGREYDAQVSVRTEEGRLQKPDFIVYLPGKKAVIVDSKVSLSAYERFCSAPEEKEKQTALAEHLVSVRKHIEELRQKAYEHLLGNTTLDFVIMCIPVEPAYQFALQNDKNLIYDLAKGNVVITGPSTLMLTLKLIAQIWRREKENRNAELIADRAGRLYDQVALVYDAMTEAKKELGHVQDSFDIALKRLKEGKGNLVGRVEELRKLGAKTSKQIPIEADDGPDPLERKPLENRQGAGP
jgi:DNA recombination protein RmuC